MDVCVYIYGYLNKGSSRTQGKLGGTQNPFMSSRLCLTPAQHLGNNPKCIFPPFILNVFQKQSFYSVVW